MQSQRLPEIEVVIFQTLSGKCRGLRFVRQYLTNSAGFEKPIHVWDFVEYILGASNVGLSD